MLPITKQIKQINCYAGQNRPHWIVVHETDNFRKGTGAATHARAHNIGSLSTSVQYYVDDVAIYQTLEHDDGAWAVGKEYGKPPVAGVNNCNTINIEICVNPDSDYDRARFNCIDLVKYLIRETGIPADRVIRHYDAKLKWCPRKMMDNPALWTSFKAALAVQDKKSGWHDEDGVRRYYNGDTGQCVRNNWREVDGKWYWFDGAGRMVTDVWYRYDGSWYYLGADGAMVKGLQAVDGKWYYLGQDGRMATEPVTLTPDADGVLMYPGLAE